MMAKALRLEETCPKCGSHLMVREGENGDFLACPRFPACKFTKPLTESYFKDNVLQGVYQKPSPYCEKCNHTGLIPFKNKEGKVIPRTFTFCECHKEEPEHYSRLHPEDIDFPISYSFHRSLCQQHGWLDPGPLEPPEYSIGR